MIAWLRRVLGLKPRRLRQPGESCGTCHWCDMTGDDPEDEPNGYCLEPGNAAENHPYAGSFTHTQSWCRLWKAADGREGR
jgi:hypothetical protein